MFGHWYVGPVVCRWLVVCGGQWYVVVSVVWGQWYGISTVCGVSGLSRSVVVCEINGEGGP